jgi:hypothetical protein
MRFHERRPKTYVIIAPKTTARARWAMAGPSLQ